MLRKGPIIFLLAAVVLAGFAAWGANQWIRAQADRAAASRVSTSPVVVAAGELEPGQPLEGKDLGVVNWPNANLPAGHFSKTAQVAGRVLKVAMTKGEVVLPAKLAQEGLAGGLSAVVPDGFRAMTVRVDEVIGVGGFVQAGDKVDVLATLDRGPFSQNPATQVVLRAIPVLTVGERLQEEGEGSKAKRRKVTVVTLQVRPEEGERLALVATEGKVVLALRNQGDLQDAATPGISMTALMPGGPPKPPPAASRQEEEEGPKVEIIKVATSSQQTFTRPVAKDRPRRSAVSQADDEENEGSVSPRPCPKTLPSSPGR